MTQRRILQLTKPTDRALLLSKSKSVDLMREKVTLRNTITDLTDTLYEAVPRDHPKGAGLSAVQIGQPTQVFLMHYYIDPSTAPITKAYINPILEFDDDVKVDHDWMGCFSNDFLRVRVERPSKVHVTAHVLEIDSSPTLESIGLDSIKKSTETFSGPNAYAVQHEFDHLQGITVLNYVRKQSLQLFLDNNGQLPDSYPDDYNVFSVHDAYMEQGRVSDANKMGKSPDLKPEERAAIHSLLEVPTRSQNIVQRRRLEY